MGKTRQAFLYVSIMFLFVCFYAYAKENSHLSRLDEIIAAMSAEQVALNEWSVYMKQSLHNTSSLIAKLDEFTWKKLNDSTMQGTYEYPMIQMKEIVTIRKKQHTPQYLLTYEAIGSSFLAEHWLQAKPIIEKKQQSLFSKEIQPFAFVRGKTIENDKRQAEELVSALLHHLHGEEIEYLAEEDFLAVSAFRKDWPNALVTGDKEMNLQLAVRVHDDFIGLKTVTLGTPIITTEY